MLKKRCAALCIFLPVLLLTACASEGPETPTPTDPYQGFNQSMFAFNDHVYTYVSHPVNTAYTTVVPSVARTGIKNAFRNVGTILDMGNDLLQWNWRYFAKDTARFVLNTTLGLLGLIDVAGHSGLPAHQQGFTYTLAKWGYSHSNYLVLPFFGPSTVSGAISLVPDYMMTPLYYANLGQYEWPVIGLYALNMNAQGVPRYQFLKANAIDPYSAMREAYLENRAYVIEQIKTDGDVEAITPGTLDNSIASGS